MVHTQEPTDRVQAVKQFTNTEYSHSVWIPSQLNIFSAFSKGRCLSIQNVKLLIYPRLAIAFFLCLVLWLVVCMGGSGVLMLRTGVIGQTYL